MTTTPPPRTQQSWNSASIDQGQNVTQNVGSTIVSSEVLLSEVPQKPRDGNNRVVRFGHVSQWRHWGHDSFMWETAQRNLASNRIPLTHDLCSAHCLLIAIIEHFRWKHLVRAQVIVSPPYIIMIALVSSYCASCCQVSGVAASLLKIASFHLDLPLLLIYSSITARLTAYSPILPEIIVFFSLC